MNRILVGQTIGRGYRFLLHRFFAILGLSWLPALALGVVGALWFVHFASDVALVSKGALAAYWLALDGLALFASLAFFTATIAVPATREALGLHDETVFAHFVVGRRELRLFLALLRFALLLFTAAVLLSFALGFVARMALPVLAAKMGATSEASAVWHGIALRTLVLGGAGFVLISALVFLTLRLGFFLAPIAAIEDRARVTRAWMLSRGNFWRVLIVTLALAVPVDLIARAVEFALFGRQLQVLLPQVLAARDPSLLAAWTAQHAMVLAAIGSTVLTLLVALFAGASAIAYRTLMPAGDMQPVWQPAVREHVEEAPMFPAVPAMASPPLDVTLGDHHVFVADRHVTHIDAVDAHAAPTQEPVEPTAMAVEAAHETHEPEPAMLPEAVAADAPAEHVAASDVVVPADVHASDVHASEVHVSDPHDALPDHAHASDAGVLELVPADTADATHADATHEAKPADMAVSEHAAVAEDHVPVASHAVEAEPAPAAEPITDVVENILPTGDPEVAPKEKVLEAAE
jgi:hypothetical protein